MSRRTTLILGIIAAGLLAFILLFERHTLSSGQLAERSHELIQSFVRDEVSRIVIERPEGDVVLERSEPDDADAFPEFRLTAPVEADADSDAVDSLLGALGWATARRKVEGIDAQDRHTFGLDEPRLSARFTVANRTVPIIFGGEDPQGGGLYVQLEDDSVAYVVGRDLLEALDHDADHFRSKELFGELRVQRATGLHLDAAGSGPVLLRRDGRWWVMQPIEAYASGSAVSDVLRRLSELRAARFVAERPEGGSAPGLDHASTVITISRDFAPSEEARARQEARLVIGGPCEGHEDERVVRVDDGPVVCVTADSVEGLSPGVEQLRERRVLTARDDDVQGVRIEARGATLSLQRTEEGWAFGGGDAAGASDADADAVAALLRGLRGAVAEEFLAVDGHALSDHGLDPPVAILTLELADEGEQEVVRLGRTQGDWTSVQRGGEPQILRVPATVAASFDPSPVRFRSRRLIEEDAADLASIRVERAGLVEQAERGSGGYRLTAPLAVGADPGAIHDLATALSTLRAVRWVADRPSAAQGLGLPRLVLRAHFEDASEGHDHGHGHGQGAEAHDYVLRVGSVTQGGSFARLGDDQAVFVVSEALLAAAETPLVDRGVLGTDSDQVQRIEITTGGRTVAVERRGDHLVPVGGGEGDTARIRALVDHLAALRAVRVLGFGPEAAARGVGEPRARVVVRRTDAAPEPHAYTLLIGAQEGEGADAVVHVRRDDIDVGFVVTAQAAAAFLDYGP